MVYHMNKEAEHEVSDFWTSTIKLRLETEVDQLIMIKKTNRGQHDKQKGRQATTSYVVFLMEFMKYIRRIRLLPPYLPALKWTSIDNGFTDRLKQETSEF